MVVRQRMVMYLRRTALRRVELDGEPRRDVRGEGSVFEVGDGGVVGLMERRR